MLPETITVGSFPDYSECTVSWAVKDNPGADINKLGPGEYVVIGAVESGDAEVAELAPELKLKIVDGSALLTNSWVDRPETAFVGQDLMLEQRSMIYVECYYADGSSCKLPVKWDYPAEDWAAEPGHHVMIGTIPGTSFELTQTVDVYRALSASVRVDWIFADYPTSDVQELDWPIIVAEDANGEELVIDTMISGGILHFDWTNLPESYDQAGEYTLEGKLSLGEAELPISHTIAVYPAPSSIEDFEADDFDTWVTPGERPFPKDGIYAKNPAGSGDENEPGKYHYAIVWEEPDSQQYANEGSFTMTGAIKRGVSWMGEDLGISAQATICVTQLEALDFPEEITTNVGEAPEIPRSAVAKTTDGNVWDYIVLYSEVPEELYAQVGDFEYEVMIRQFQWGMPVGSVLDRKVTIHVVDPNEPGTDPDEPVDPEPEPEPEPEPTPDPDPTPVPTPDPDEDVEVPEAEGGTVEVEPVPAGETATVVAEPDAGQEVRDIIVTDADGNEVETVVDGDGNVTFEMPEGGVTVEVVFGCDGGELCGTHAYPDIDQDQWYHDSVDWAIEEGVFHGYDDGTFGPNDVLTREQAAAVLYNYLGGTEGSPGSGLTDVADDWYTDAVNWAVENGVMTGYEGTGTFGVGEALTREQFCAVVAKAMRVDLSDVDTSVLDGFADAGSVSDWAKPAVAWAVQQGIVNGVENADGTRSLQGVRDITRAEMAAMMLNAVDAGVLAK